MSYLTKHHTAAGARWACDGRLLPVDFELGRLLALPAAGMAASLEAAGAGASADGTWLAPLDDTTEVWAAGVTYLRSREAREAESSVRDVYSKVYEAERPEIFFKAIGWRVAGHGMPIRIRADSHWNVPEPELTLVINSRGEIAGYCAGNDVSSRDIEGENPLYLPQAKVYNGSCALGPGIMLRGADELQDLPVTLVVTRAGRPIVEGATRTSQLKRRLQDLAGYLGRELAFPRGVLLMTGTGIVPPDGFSLQHGDVVRVTVGELLLENEVAP